MTRWFPKYFISDSWGRPSWLSAGWSRPSKKPRRRRRCNDFWWRIREWFLKMVEFTMKIWKMFIFETCHMLHSENMGRHLINPGFLPKWDDVTTEDHSRDTLEVYFTFVSLAILNTWWYLQNGKNTTNFASKIDQHYFGGSCHHQMVIDVIIAYHCCFSLHFSSFLSGRPIDAGRQLEAKDLAAAEKVWVVLGAGAPWDGGVLWGLPYHPLK